MNQVVFDYEMIAAPSPANLNASPLARLSDSAQGQQLLENLKTLEGLRSEYARNDDDIAWSCDSHKHLLCCFKLFSVFTHMKFGAAVKTTSRHEFIFKGSTLRRHGELFVDLGQLQSGQCWAVITFEGDTSCD